MSIDTRSEAKVKTTCYIYEVPGHQITNMAAVNMAMNGERKSHDKAYSKPLENGLLPAVAEKLELEETGAIVGDKAEMEDEFEDEEPPVGEIKVRCMVTLNVIHVHLQT